MCFEAYTIFFGSKLYACLEQISIDANAYKNGINLISFCKEIIFFVGSNIGTIFFFAYFLLWN
jgi:hypothetical protein